MAVQFVNRVWFATATTGTGTLGVGAALAGYQTPAAAGFVSGNAAGYTILDGANFEVGIGTLTTGTPWTLSRDTVEASSVGGLAKISLSGTATVFLTATASQVAPIWTIGNGLEINSGTISADTQGTITATATGTITPAGLQSCIVNVGTVDTTLAITPGYQGQHLRLEIKQGATPHLVALDATFAFSADIPSYTATATANARDLIQTICLDGTHWAVAAINKGFAV